MSKNLRPTFRSTWQWPLALAALTVAGLLAALLGQGGAWWDLAWTALSIPLVALAWCIAKAFVAVA